MDAETMARLDARMERMEKALERVVSLLDQVQPQVAMAVDIADDWAATRIGGDGLEQRLVAVESALVRLTEPAILNSLVQLAELGPRLHRVAELAAGFDDTVAMAVDVADDWAEQRGGAEIDARVGAALHAVDQVTEPAVIEALSHLAKTAPALTRLADLGATFDDTVAMAADVADEWVRDNVGGASMEDRLGAVRDAAIGLSDPSVLAAITTLAALAPRLTGSAHVAAELDAFVSSTSDVLREPAAPVGFFGLLSALGDPEIQRGVGRVLQLTRHLGRNETLLPVKR